MRTLCLSLTALLLACTTGELEVPSEETPSAPPVEEDPPVVEEPPPVVEDPPPVVEDPPPVVEDPPPVIEDPPPLLGGCGQVAPTDEIWSVEHDGGTRTFRVHVPNNYDAETPTPLVISLHGRAVTARSQETTSRFSALADEEGFIVVYPEGTGGNLPTWNAGVCCGQAMQDDVDDVGFIDALIDSLEDQLCIDSGRVYANGLSNGAFMAYRLACERADRFAAVGAVAGVNGVFPCSASRAVPVLHFHGTADTVVPYEGNFGFTGTSVDAHIDGWVERNACAGQPTVFFDEADTLCERWTGCDDEAAVELCTITGGGHQWPGGVAIPLLGHMSDTVDASAEMWRFFAQHSL